jgi:hypothetical protein
MERGRILILGQTKENSYEVRNLFDNRRFELEFALNKEMGKFVLSNRLMNLLILHTEAIDEEATEFFAFLNDKGISIPVVIVGEDAASFREQIDHEAELAPTVVAFDKPYAVDSLLDYVDAL